MYTYPPPRFVRRVRSGCKFCLRASAPRLLLIAYVSAPPPIWTGMRSRIAPPSLLGRIWKSCLLLHVLANIHYYALWIHHIIHTNLSCCSTPYVLFSFLQQHHIHLFLQKPHNTQKQNYWKTTRITIRIDRPGPQNSPNAIMRSASFVHWNHITCLPHCVANMYASKQQ